MQYFTCQYVVTGTTSARPVVQFNNYWCDNCDEGTFHDRQHHPFDGYLLDEPVREITKWPKRCSDCSAKASKASRRRKLVDRLQKDADILFLATGMRPILLTLTWPKLVPLEELESIRKVMINKFKLLRRKYNMPYGYYGFEFDTHYKNGIKKGEPKVIDGVIHCNPHIHCVYWGQEIDHAELSERVQKYGFGKIVDIRYVRKMHYAAKYVGKYMVKGKRTVQTFGKAIKVFEQYLTEVLA